MTQYLLSVHGSDEDYAAVAEEDVQRMYAAVDQFNQKLQAEGAWVFAGGLCPVDTATTVDATGDEVLTVDGPYLETKEHIGGFWVIEAPDLDAALSWAAQGSAACEGKVEVRPFQSE